MAEDVRADVPADARQRTWRRAYGPAAGGGGPGGGFGISSMPHSGSGQVPGLSNSLPSWEQPQGGQTYFASGDFPSAGWAKAIGAAAQAQAAPRKRRRAIMRPSYARLRAAGNANLPSKKDIGERRGGPFPPRERGGGTVRRGAKSRRATVGGGRQCACRPLRPPLGACPRVTFGRAPGGG